jgi:hypothetical protein
MRCRLIVLLAACAALAATSARAEVLITVDKAAQLMTVTVDGAQRYAWPVSTGIADYDTPAGDFQPFRMERDHFSREWDDAPMPFSIFFTQEGHAIHGTNHLKNLGRPASHGCVRLSKDNAGVLFALVKEQGVKNTHVTLTGDLPDNYNVGSIMREEPPLTYDDTRRKRSARATSSDNPRYYYRDGPYVAPRRAYGGFPFGW